MASPQRSRQLDPPLDRLLDRRRLRQTVFQQVQRWVSGAIALGVWTVSMATTSPMAQAERPTGLRMCISSPEPRDADVYVALAYKTQNRVAGVAFEDWVSQGWWKLDKALSYSCITLLTEELKNRQYYFYAQGGDRVWEGNDFFCMDPLKSYVTDEADVNCEANGLARRGFRQVDTLGDRGFTIRLE